MMTDNFRALVLDQQDGKLAVSIRELQNDSLPQGDLTIDVEFSSLNYKDGLAVTGTGKIIRHFPMIPGIDLAGTVAHSDNPAFQQGDRVVVTGWGLGERHWGGYATRARVKSAWAVKLPESLGTQHAMAIGTAGFTAMLSVLALEKQSLQPGDEVLVTGAAGGVGSIAVAILAQLGYNVTASTGRPETHDYLRSLGAANIIDRATLSNPTPKPLESERWTGAVDSVGGVTLANVIKSTRYRGSVAACGLAGGTDLPTTVFPFILRGVNLLGIDSVQCPDVPRREAWNRLSRDLPLDKLDAIATVIPLDRVEQSSREILGGNTRGRVVVDVKS